MEEATVLKDLRGYQDPDVQDDGMPPADDDSPDLGATGSRTLVSVPGTSGYPGEPPHDLPSDGIELQYGPGGFPPQGSGTIR